MKTRDPFLSTFGIVFDRLAVWLILVIVAFVLLWSGIWERGLSQPWTEAINQLRVVLSGHGEPITNTLAALTLTVSIESASLLAAWMFVRWRRQGELGAMHVRGSRLGE
jgi:hypothetical protein